MGGFRTEPKLAELLSAVDELNGKVTVANTDRTYTYSPLEAAMSGNQVGVFSYLEELANTGDKTNVYITNPTTNGTAKFAMYIDTTGQGQINVYHDPTVDTGSATQLTAKPILIGQTVNLQATAYAGVTISTTTPDMERVIPGGLGRFAQGNTTVGLPGFGLLPGHSVAIEVVNLSSNSNTVSIFAVCWEGG